MKKQEEILEFTKEILADIELDRITGEKILLKTKRLLRLRPEKDNDIEEWIDYELRGYDNGSISEDYMEQTKRWTNEEHSSGYFESLVQIETLIKVNEKKLLCYRTTDSSGNDAILVNYGVTNSINKIGIIISHLSGIKGSVFSILHDYITDVYYSITYEKVIDSIFEKYKQDIDKSITKEAKDVIEMLPSVMDRLQEKDSESISQALSSCRRIIDTFADFIFPPSDETITINGNELKLQKKNAKNRINVYIDTKITSKTRKDRLRQNLSNLYERVCNGIHSDVTFEEAKALIFNTYLLMGEVLNLEDGVTSN
jgi:hypothetical protein